MYVQHVYILAIVGMNNIGEILVIAPLSLKIAKKKIEIYHRYTFKTSGNSNYPWYLEKYNDYPRTLIFGGTYEGDTCKIYLVENTYYWLNREMKLMKTQSF